jgi:subtilisin family serine protease
MFGDGSTATAATVSHTFQRHGAYTATVAVNDGRNTTTSSPLMITVTPAPPTVQPLTIQANVLGVTQTSIASQVSASDRENLALTYTLKTPPMIGTATVNANTGAIMYTVPGFVAATSDSFVVTVANLGASTASTVNVSLNSDPLITNQWHIQNRGQDAFSTTPPVAGNDINVTPAWTAGYTGKGIKVGVVDSGLEAAHEDLAANVDVAHSLNFVTGGSDPTPTTPGYDHGTSVSGIIGGVAFNGKGGRGIAYNVRLRGYNYLKAQSNANLAASFGGVAASADNDVFNASFGTVTAGLQSQNPMAIQVDIQATTLRGGLGAPLVYAAGNNFLDIEGTNDPLCAESRKLGVSCGDPANDEHNQDSIPIVVAALNASGTHASYSSTGASVWVSAYGGEYGWNANFATGVTPSADAAPYVLLPAIVTTSIDGCANANIQSPLNPLDDLGLNPLAPKCQYTATMNGTSAATPNVTGVIALMLEANPNLSWRDVKYILATTAKKVDSGFIGISAPIFNATNVVLEQGWTQNAAGHWFSNRYGFGGVDAGAAVTAAKAYTSYLPPLKTSATYSVLAGGTGYVLAAGVPFQFTVQESFKTVESVFLGINIYEAHDAGTSGLTCTQVELQSPSGTKSILMHAGNGFTNAQVNKAILGSNAFYGETVNGVWTATFYDFCTFTNNPTWLSLTVPQQFAIVGH